MIDPKELRIGNIVYVQGRKLSQPRLIELAIDKVVRQSCSQYDPIPITPEWLEWLGFESKEPNKWQAGEEGLLVNQQKIVFDQIDSTFYYLTNQYYVEELDKEISCVISDDIKYVHQLQNLYYALTGKELELKD